MVRAFSAKICVNGLDKILRVPIIYLPNVTSLSKKSSEGTKMPFFISIKNAFSVFEWVHFIAYHFVLVQPIEKSLCAILVNIHIFNLAPSNFKFKSAFKSY